MQKDGGGKGGPPRRVFGKTNFLGGDLGENLKSVILKDFSTRRAKSHEIVREEREIRKRKREGRKRNKKKKKGKRRKR